MKPNHNQRRESDGNRDQMQGAVHRMIVCTVVVRVEAHVGTSSSGGDYSAGVEINLSKTSFESNRPRAVRRIISPSAASTPLVINSVIVSRKSLMAAPPN